MRTLGEIVRELRSSIGKASKRVTRPSAGNRADLRNLAAWPPDTFAFTSIALADSGVYRFAVSPPEHRSWPPGRAAEWQRRIARAGARWRIAATREDDVPIEVSRRIDVIARHLDVELRDLPSDKWWPVCAAILELHAMADESSAGLGLGARPGEPGGTSEILFRLRANTSLAKRGTLSRISERLVRVLPKMRTAQTGITIRSMSHHLAIDRSEVRVRWNLAKLCREDLERLNLLLLPWPRDVAPTEFIPTDGRLLNMDASRFGFFEYKPRRPFDLEWAEAMIKIAKQRSGTVDGVVLPELALDESEVAPLKDVLKRHDVSFLLAGVRGPRSNRAYFAAAGPSGAWTDYVQSKHHRWNLDANQIQNYHLGAALHPNKRWWEDIAVPHRELNFVVANGWLSICPLICEDLARQDPCAPILRSVGPTLVVALLFDGPQLGGRWPARYATVLADDPGSSVLTLSATGMVRRSVPPGGTPSNVVAMWKDALGGGRELSLQGDASALLITLSARWNVEWAADGRTDHNAAQLVLSSVESLSLSSSTSPSAELR
jgi:hypothetical protein